MKARRDLDQRAQALGQLREFGGAPALAEELRLAREDYFGPGVVPAERPEQAPEQAAFFDWFLFDRPLSTTGLTPVRTFVEAHPELPADLRANLLACEQSLYSTFRVVEVGPERYVVLDLLGDDDDYYRVVAEADRPALRVGELVTARLLRWSDDYWFHGLIEAWPHSTRGLGLARASGGRQRVTSAVAAPLDSASPGGYASRRNWLRERRQRP